MRSRNGSIVVAASLAVTAMVTTAGIDAPVSATAPAPVAGFPAAVSDDGRLVVDAAGDPWFMVGDAGWSSLVMLTSDEIALYFDTLAAKGFNTVLVNIIETWYSTHTPANDAGDGPFTGDLYQSPPNEPYWQWVDDYVAAAAERGITLLAVPAYLGYQADGVGGAVEAATNEQLLEFGRFLGDRYADAPNIIWVIGGDRTGVSDVQLERMDSMATGIEETAPQLITAHVADDANAADVYGQYSWLDLNNSYDRSGQPVADALSAYEQEPVRPTFSSEGIYEQDMGNPGLPSGAVLLRYQAYAPVLAGSFGHIFGNNPRWHFEGVGLAPYEGTWQDSLDDPDGDLDLGTVHMTHFAEFFGSIAWHQLVPDLSDQFLVDGEGEGTEQAAAAIAAAEGFGVVYTVSTSAITLDLGALSAVDEVVVRRLDPTNGETVDVGTYPTDGPVTIEHPGPNDHGDNDWVYLVAPTGA